MTRINLVPVEELMDQHLMAEYRELPRIFTYVRSLQDKGRRPKGLDISGKYCFGPGHVKFFVDKLGWLTKRFESLVAELKIRGFKIQYETASVEGLKPYWFGDFEPSEEDLELSRARIQARIADRPNWYRNSRNV